VKRRAQLAAWRATNFSPRILRPQRIRFSSDAVAKCCSTHAGRAPKRRSRSRRSSLASPWSVYRSHHSNFRCLSMHLLSDQSINRSGRNRRTRAVAFQLNVPDVAWTMSDINCPTTARCAEAYLWISTVESRESSAHRSIPRRTHAANGRAYRRPDARTSTASSLTTGSPPLRPLWRARHRLAHADDTRQLSAQSTDLRRALLVIFARNRRLLSGAIPV
jgi:hypothetical protein